MKEVKMSRCIHIAMAAAVAATWLIVGAPAASAVGAPQSADVCALQTAERVVAIGDVHGAFDEFVTILREAKLIDNRRRWIGGRAILVQTGDVLDRGAESRRVVDLLRSLEPEAAKAGGRVVALLGNHEAMRIMGDRRYISAGEYAEFRESSSEELRERAHQFMADDNAKRAKAAGREFDAASFRKQFYTDNPPGAIEMQLAFGPKGDYGLWVRERPATVKINDVMFVHGGFAPEVASLGCPGINAAARAELNGPIPPPNQDKSLTAGGRGPLWYRGLATDAAEDPAAATDAEIAAVLTALGAKAIVVGHTVAPDNRIRVRAGGRVIQIDTGMLGGEFYPGGRASALEIHGGKFTAIYEGSRVPLETTSGVVFD
jgi:hypothetical protein